MTPAKNRIQAHCHPDFLRLEDELCRRIEALTGADPGSAPDALPRILVFATTKRQRDHLRIVLAKHFGGLLGADILTHFGYVQQMTTGRNIQPLPVPLQEALIKGLAETKPDDSLRSYLRNFPAAVRSIAARFSELREALVGPGNLLDVAKKDSERTLAALFAAYCRSLDSLANPDAPRDPPARATTVGNAEARRFMDRAAQTHLAATIASRQPPIAAVFQYGAHELLAMNLELIRAVPCDAPVQWLAPVDLEAKAWEYARLAVADITDNRVPLEDAQPRPLVDAARSFFDRELQPKKLPAELIRLVDAQGPESEVETVARQIMADLFERSVEPHDIAVVARSVEPYAPALESAFIRHAIPADSSLLTPLAREPEAHTFLGLLRALAHNLERQAVMDLARTPALACSWKPETVDGWDIWSRRSRIVRGHESWLDATQHRSNTNADNPEQSVRELTAFITRLEQARLHWSKAKTAADHITVFKQWCADWIQGKTDALNQALESLEALDIADRALSGAGTRLSPETMLQHVERLVRETQKPWSTPNGVSVLDVMQARGLVFKRVYWIGFNADWFPRSTGEDPFLGETLRQRLREHTGQPLKVHTHDILEERLLLAQTALSAQDFLQISWQRANADGQSMAASLFLDQWRRVWDEHHRVPTHPKAFAEWQHEHTGMLLPSEGALLSTWMSGHRRDQAMRAFTQAVGQTHLTPNLDLAAAIDRSNGSDLRFDARIEQPGSWTDHFSPSSLESLGKCPLQYFFSRVLGIRSLRDQAQETGADALDTGSLIHKVLELAFPQLAPDKPAEGTLAEVFDTVFTSVRKRVASRYPLAWESFRANWLRELTAFVTTDVERFQEEGWTYQAGEHSCTKTVSLPTPENAFLPESTSIVLTGKLDRVAVNSRGDVLVSDYKTGGRIETWTAAGEYLRGHKLQLPLYRLLAEPREGSVTVELLGLGPGFQPDRGFVNSGPVTLSKKYNHAAFLESIAALAYLAHNGLFPMHPSADTCRTCDFALACRKTHVPSVDRLAVNETFSIYRLLQRKTGPRPFLSNVEDIP